MARPSPPRSALSEPQNFIAEGPLRRLYRRHRWILWCTLLVGAVGIGSALSIARYRQAGVEHEARTVLRKTNAPAGRTEPKGEARPLWTADDLKQGVVTTEPAPERFTKLPPPPLTPEPEPAPAPADAAPKSAEARNPTAEAALDVEPPKSAGEPRAADTPKQAETTASVSNKPEAISPHGEATPPAEAAAVPGNSVEKADRYLKRGQYTIARYLYEEAYQSGEILGAVGMAKSYDASYLKSIGLQAKGDAPKARIWYRRAAEMSGKRRQGTP